MNKPKYRSDANLDRFLADIYEQEQSQRAFNDYTQGYDYEQYESEREAIRKHEVFDDEF